MYPTPMYIHIYTYMPMLRGLVSLTVIYIDRSATCMHLCFILYISHVAAIMQPLFGIDHEHYRLDHAVKLIAVCTTQTMQIHTAVNW